MKSITYFSKGATRNKMLVEDNHDRDHLRVSIAGFPVVLNSVQVDKLRQQFHGWLHERANSEDGDNWVEHGEGSSYPPPYPTRV